MTLFISWNKVFPVIYLIQQLTVNGSLKRFGLVTFHLLNNPDGWRSVCDCLFFLVHRCNCIWKSTKLKSINIWNLEHTLVCSFVIFRKRRNNERKNNRVICYMPCQGVFCIFAVHLSFFYSVNSQYAFLNF